MVVNSQEIYKKLLLRSPDPKMLKFGTLALAAAGPDGELDEDRLKDLIRLFRPDRDGKRFEIALRIVSGSRPSNDLRFLTC